ncbi:MAG: DUF2927 domain-containing protein [Bacteroidota bacterium]|nr:DUF2927 domain-containing protein [Bacteroidota bacterium]
MKIFLLLSILFVITECSFDSEINKDIINSFSEEELFYFYQLAFEREFQSTNHKLCLWTRNVSMELIGEHTCEDSAEVARIKTELNELIDPIELNIVKNNGNLKIYYVDHNYFNSLFPITLNTRGYFAVKWNRFFPRGIIFVDKNQSLLKRRHIVREEITQALGLMNDSQLYKKSVFYQGNSNITEYTEIDKQMIRLLYNYKLPYYYHAYNFRNNYIVLKKNN